MKCRVKTRAPGIKAMLLPVQINVVREISLASHLSRIALRSGNGAPESNVSLRRASMRRSAGCRRIAIGDVVPTRRVHAVAAAVAIPDGNPAETAWRETKKRRADGASLLVRTTETRSGLQCLLPQRSSNPEGNHV